ncbi:MAG: Hsp20/alpha crystallin family protein [Dissulfuribacterales bacterium]
MLLKRIINYPSTFRTFNNPFAELERIRNEMDMLTENFLSRSPRLPSTSGVFPAINLTEDTDHYYLRAELPGVKSEELDIQATGKNLAISGERKIPAENEAAKYHRRERDSGKFSRIIDLPGDINAEKVAAKLENGILTITIPKAEMAKPRQIKIN